MMKVMQSYHLLLEDGRKALFLSVSNKEPFTLCRYQEEVGKDFERISLFLCPEYGKETLITVIRLTLVLTAMVFQIGARSVTLI